MFPRANWRSGTALGLIKNAYRLSFLVVWAYTQLYNAWDDSSTCLSLSLLFSPSLSVPIMRFPMYARCFTQYVHFFSRSARTCTCSSMPFICAFISICISFTWYSKSTINLIRIVICTQFVIWFVNCCCCCCWWCCCFFPLISFLIEVVYYLHIFTFTFIWMHNAHKHIINSNKIALFEFFIGKIQCHWSVVPKYIIWFLKFIMISTNWFIRLQYGRMRVKMRLRNLI